MRTWPLREAKSRLNEVVDKALQQGPQVITRRGAETAIVLSMEDYRKLRQPNLVDFFQASPLTGVDLDRAPDTRAYPGLTPYAEDAPHPHEVVVCRFS